MGTFLTRLDSVHLIPCLCLAKGVCSVRVAFLSTAAPRRGALPDPEQQPSLKFFVSWHTLGPAAASRHVTPSLRYKEIENGRHQEGRRRATEEYGAASQGATATRTQGSA
jgi:hypothetical protein